MKTATLVASPGCYPAVAALALVPLLEWPGSPSRADSRTADRSVVHHHQRRQRRERQQAAAPKPTALPRGQRDSRRTGSACTGTSRRSRRRCGGLGKWEVGGKEVAGARAPTRCCAAPFAHRARHPRNHLCDARIRLVDTAAVQAAARGAYAAEPFVVVPVTPRRCGCAADEHGAPQRPRRLGPRRGRRGRGQPRQGAAGRRCGTRT